MFSRSSQVSNEHSLSALLELLKLDEYISFDLETTGLDPISDKITEISACRFVKGEYFEEFTTLINPEIPIPENIILPIIRNSRGFSRK